MREYLGTIQGLRAGKSLAYFLHCERQIPLHSSIVLITAGNAMLTYILYRKLSRRRVWASYLAKHGRRTRFVSRRCPTHLYHHDLLGPLRVVDFHTHSIYLHPMTPVVLTTQFDDNILYSVCDDKRFDQL